MFRVIDIFISDNKHISTITTINASDSPKDSRVVINTNFSNLNSDKAETTVIPVKATGAEITTGTDDAKFATAKAIKDAGIGSGNFLLMQVFN